MNGVDAGLFRAMNRLADRTRWAHRPMVAYAKVGIIAFAVLLLLGWWGARTTGDLDRLARLLWAGAGALAAVGINQLIGSLVARARPYEAMPNVHVLIPRTGDFSFPSDHAVAAGAVAAGLVLAQRRLGSVAVVLAVVMAVARVYVGAHYPADVVAGLLLGAVVVALGSAVAVRPLRALVGTVGRSRLRPAVAAARLGGDPPA